MIDVDALLKYIEHDNTSDVARSGEISAVIRLLRDEVRAWRYAKYKGGLVEDKHAIIADAALDDLDTAVATTKVSLKL